MHFCQNIWMFNSLTNFIVKEDVILPVEHHEYSYPLLICCLTSLNNAWPFEKIFPRPCDQPTWSLHCTGLHRHYTQWAMKRDVYTWYWWIMLVYKVHNWFWNRQEPGKQTNVGFGILFCDCHQDIGCEFSLFYVL